MKKHFFISTLILVLFSFDAFSTAQIPDILWYNGTKYSLFANPLESYFNEDNPRPEVIAPNACWSTACWRGYQATWKIIDDELYLIKIGGCCDWEKYKITDEVIELLRQKDVPEDILTNLEPIKNREIDKYDLDEELRDAIGKSKTKKYAKLIRKHALIEVDDSADLNELFGENVQNGIVKAFWFSGDLKIPQGEILEYVHMGYMSTYERELVIEVEDGNVLSVIEYENEPGRMPKNFKFLNATSYSLFVPSDLLDIEEDYWYSMTDTLALSTEDSSKFISTLSAFHENRMNRDDRFSFVESMVNEFTLMHDDISFEERQITKTRWGTCAWVDGKSENVSTRYFIISNINGYMSLVYQEKDAPYEFRYHAETICESVRLMEFSF